MVKLLNTKLKNTLAVLIKHVESLGQTIVTVTNCSLSTSIDDKPVPELGMSLLCSKFYLVFFQEFP